MTATAVVFELPVVRKTIRKKGNKGRFDGKEGKITNTNIYLNKSQLLC